MEEPGRLQCEESDTTERLHFYFSLSRIGEGNGNPLQCSCLENPRDGGAWWAAIHRVAQSRTRLKRLSSSSMYLVCKMVADSERGFEFSQTPAIRRKQQEENVLFGARRVSPAESWRGLYSPWLIQAPSVFWRGHLRASWRQPQKLTQPSLNQTLRKVPTVSSVFPNCLRKEMLGQIRGTHEESTVFHWDSNSFTGTRRFSKWGPWIPWETLSEVCKVKTIFIIILTFLYFSTLLTFAPMMKRQQRVTLLVPQHKRRQWHQFALVIIAFFY